MDKFRSIGPYKNHLERLARYVKGTGTEMAFITQPSLYKSELTPQERRRLKFGPVFCSERSSFVTRRWPSVETMRQAMIAFNRQAASVAESNGIYLIDAASKLARSLENFEDDVHHTDAGGRRLGMIVAEALATSGILESIVERRER